MKLNKKILNVSAWIVVLLTYLLPTFNYQKNELKFGYPIPFLTIHNKEIQRTLLTSFNLNLVILTIDIVAVYFIVNLIIKVYTKNKKSIKA